MIALKEIMSKSPIELIDLFMGNIIQGDMSQVDLLIDIIRANLLTSEKIETESRLQRFVEDVKKGAEENNLHAINILTFIYQKGLGVEQDCGKAITLYGPAVHLGDTFAMYNLANMYRNGQGIKQNYDDAIKLYKQAIELNYAPAMTDLANMCRSGQGIEQNYGEAITLYEQAIKLNYAPAMNNLAFMYANAQGGEQNYGEAIKLYEQAINLGNPFAMTNLANMYTNGQGIEQNYGDAIKLYEQAIKLGNAFAMNNLAFMHRNGLGVEQNYAKAIKLYEQAVNLGDVSAMNNLARIYKQHANYINHSKAARLFRQAAEKGLLVSRKHLKEDIQSVYQYHYCMLNNEVESAVKLVVTHSDLIHEFIEYDFIPTLFNPETLKRTDDIIQSILAQIKEKTAPQDLILSLLNACEDWETSNPEPPTEVRTTFKVNCLNALNIDRLNEDKLSPLSHQIINLWYVVDGFTDNAVSLLTNILYKAKLKSISFDSICLRNMAVIFIKKLYKEEYRISLNEWTMEQVMLLMGFIECGTILTLETINTCLGAELIHPLTTAAVNTTPQSLAITEFGLLGKRTNSDVAEDPQTETECNKKMKFYKLTNS